MFDKLNNLNINTCSESELRTLIRQTFPTVMIFAKASQRLLNEDKPNHKSCSDCNKYGTCTEICEAVENKLSEEYKGSQNSERTYGNLIDEISDTRIKDTDDNDEILRTYNNNYLKAIDRIRSDDIFILYKNCIHLFSKIEWRVIALRVEEGLTYKIIGQVLGIKTSTASDTFHRAKRRMERHYQKK